MREDFAKCLPVVLVYEGGYANNPRDPGGVTLNGITQRVDDSYRRNHGLTPRPLTRAMNGDAQWNAERDAIYRPQYWNAVRGDEVPAGIDIILFDAAVHSGPFQSIKWLQRGLAAAGLYHDQFDGHFGEGTMDALRNHPDHDALITDMCARRLGMLQHLGTWDEFGGGWTKRIANVKKIGQAWAMGSVGPAPIAVHEEGGNVKAYASDVAQPAIDAGDATKIGAGSGSISGILQGTKDQIEPLVYTSSWMSNIYLWLTIAGIVIGLGAMGYAIWAGRKTKRAQRAIDGDIMADVPEGQPA